MSWNYRVIRSEEDGEVSYAIHECHYGKKGDVVPTSWTGEPAILLSETRVGLFGVLSVMAEAIAHPVLEVRGSKLFEVEPAQELTDDIKRAIAANKEYAKGMA